MLAPSLHQELDPLGWRLAAGTLTHPAYQDALADILQRGFRCSTVALWRVSGRPGARALDCLGLYRATGAVAPVGEVLTEVRLGAYFAALNDRGVYACDDTLADHNLEAMRDRCVRAHAPRAFLDALVAINGHALGVLSCHEDAAPRRWAPAEETTLKRLGARVALHLARLALPVFGRDCRDAPRGGAR
jgi:GAF domain-containing protein